MPLFRDNLTLETGETRLFVADACSGFSTLYAAMTVACLTAYFCPVPWRRVAVLISAAPIAIAANILRVAPDGKVTEVVGARLDGRLLGACTDVTVRPDGHVFFTRLGSRGAWWLTPAGTLTELIDVNGAGNGKMLKAARGVAADGAGNVYVTGVGSHNVLRVQLDALQAGTRGSQAGK